MAKTKVLEAVKKKMLAIGAKQVSVPASWADWAAQNIPTYEESFGKGTFSMPDLGQIIGKRMAETQVGQAYQKLPGVVRTVAEAIPKFAGQEYMNVVKPGLEAGLAPGLTPTQRAQKFAASEIGMAKYPVMGAAMGALTPAARTLTTPAGRMTSEFIRNAAAGGVYDIGQALAGEMAELKGPTGIARAVRERFNVPGTQIPMAAPVGAYIGGAFGAGLQGLKEAGAAAMQKLQQAFPQTTGEPAYAPAGAEMKAGAELSVTPDFKQKFEALLDKAPTLDDKLAVLDRNIEWIKTRPGDPMKKQDVIDYMMKRSQELSGATPLAVPRPNIQQFDAVKAIYDTLDDNERAAVQIGMVPIKVQDAMKSLDDQGINSMAELMKYDEWMKAQSGQGTINTYAQSQRMKSPTGAELKTKPSRVDQIIAYESGDLPDEEAAKMLQGMIDDGSGWSLQGSYGRSMMDAIESGQAMLGSNPVKDAYGNTVPSYTMVQAGTKGSPEYVAAKMGEDYLRNVLGYKGPLNANAIPAGAEEALKQVKGANVKDWMLGRYDQGVPQDLMNKNPQINPLAGTMVSEKDFLSVTNPTRAAQYQTLTPDQKYAVLNNPEVAKTVKELMAGGYNTAPTDVGTPPGLVNYNRQSSTPKGAEESYKLKAPPKSAYTPPSPMKEAQKFFPAPGQPQQEVGDVWELESEDQKLGSNILNNIYEKAKTGGTKARNILKGLWGDNWETIKDHMEAEGSTWYVWYMDGVNKLLSQMSKTGK